MENTSTNPLLAAAVIPGETFRLPSQGLFYANGELSPDVTNGEVHVRAMTAVDELVFKSPDMLFTGKAVEQVFTRCIPQVLKPNELLSKDVDYLIMCLRVVTYGPTVSLTYNHACSDGSKEHTYEVRLQPIIQQAKQIDPTVLSTKFAVSLPNGQKVKLKPLTYRTMIALNQDVDLVNKTPSLDDLKTSVMGVLLDSIESVDGITDRALIGEWLNALSAGWVREITGALNVTSDWGANAVATEVCRDCSSAIKLEFSINPLSFFF